MTDSESIATLRKALYKLDWNRIPQGQQGALIIEVCPIQTRSIWKNLEWWESHVVDPKNGVCALTMLVMNVQMVIAAIDEQRDIVVLGRVDAPGENWHLLTIECPEQAPGSVQELLDRNKT